MIAGQYLGDAALAAVGACGYLITLLVSLFSGLAGGANVLISKRVGAQSKDGAQKAVGGSMTVGFVSGVVLMVIALLGARTFLVWINCDPEVLSQATLYLRIYFLGSRLKMEIGLCRGKKLYDKRDAIAKKESNREIERQFRSSSKYD